MNSQKKFVAAPVFRSNDRTAPEGDPREMLEMLLALDRSLVEVSMQLYNVDPRGRSEMRRDNRRLHTAMRNQLPRLLKSARRKQRTS
ncbi:MAG TPA: hypothetical protein VJQ59_03945 [Candidatus Sulfotelmatobacter sp.]|nr:hypothetical protein [Candidatus Sulfotelmatobacter sp.]